MGHKGFLGVAACGLAATVLMPTAAHAQQDRVSATEKGSLLIYSKVEVRYDSDGNLIQDTFVTMSNDGTDDVYVQMYFIDGDPDTFDPCPQIGWNFSDVLILLTANQPTYWSVNDPGGFTPFSVLEPGCPDSPPGRFDPDSGEYYIRGMIYAWAVVKNGAGGSGIVEIRHNHLSGGATLINYEDATAWEYNAWAVQRREVGDGDRVLELGDPGGDHDSAEYAPIYSQLLLNFQAVGSTAFSNGDTDLVTTDTDVTLHPVDINFDIDDPDNPGPVATKAHYDVWNENEFKLSGAFRCIVCWDQTLRSDYGIPNHFLIGTLQTDHGKARIDGLASPLCDDLPDFGDVSVDAAILGVAARDYYFVGDGGPDNGPDARSGSNLIGMGKEAAVVSYGEMLPPPEAPSNPIMLLDRIMGSR